MTIVEVSFLESASGRAFLFVFFHGFIKGFGGKDSETSLLVCILLTLSAGLGKIGVSLCLCRSSSTLVTYGLTHRGGIRIRSIILPSVVECYVTLCSQGGEVVIIEGRRGRPSFEETANGT